ncbi:MAG: hypothetical protein IPK31_20090 [Chitinophagaceae bacterium]|nr:hypothetical protein [Chitinophagaceae bacterium]
MNLLHPNKAGNDFHQTKNKASSIQFIRMSMVSYPPVSLRLWRAGLSSDK